MTPAIAYAPYSGSTACGAPFMVVGELPVAGAMLILVLLLCGAAICFLADGARRRSPTRVPPRRRVRPRPRGTAFPQRA